MSRQREAERLRWLKTDQALRRLRVDLQNRGVHFAWSRKPGPDGGERLYAVLKGGRSGQTEVGLDGYTAAAAAMMLLKPLFPSAVIEGGNTTPNGPWSVLLWLDAPESEALRREAQHPGMQPEAVKAARLAAAQRRAEAAAEEDDHN